MHLYLEWRDWMSDVRGGGHMDLGDSLFGCLFLSPWLRAPFSSSMTSFTVPGRHRQSHAPTFHCGSHTCIQGLDQKLHLHMHGCAQLFHFPRNLLITHPTWRPAGFHDVTSPAHYQSSPLTPYSSLKFKSSTQMILTSIWSRTRITHSSTALWHRKQKAW